MGDTTEATKKTDEALNDDPTTLPSQQEDSKQFDVTTSKGKEDGLFRACMKSIRTAHFRANKIRAALVFGGLFTDIKIYTHALSMFYVVTKEVETKLWEDKTFLNSLTDDERVLLQKIKDMGFRFTEGYEKDLQVLYEGILYPKSIFSYVEHIDKMIEETPICRAYQQHIQQMTKASDVAGAIFVLWGALIIGGGAMIQPKAKRLVGPNAVNVFDDIIGPKREERRRIYISTWDSLASDSNDITFHEIVNSTKQCMQYNNDMMGSGTKANPWWLKYIILIFVLFLLCVGYMIYEAHTGSSVFSLSSSLKSETTKLTQVPTEL